MFLIVNIKDCNRLSRLSSSVDNVEKFNVEGNKLEFIQTSTLGWRYVQSMSPE